MISETIVGDILRTPFKIFSEQCLHAALELGEYITSKYSSCLGPNIFLFIIII